MSACNLNLNELKIEKESSDHPILFAMARKPLERKIKKQIVKQVREKIMGGASFLRDVVALFRRKLLSWIDNGEEQALTDRGRQFLNFSD